jgi:hypothetical protein
MVDFLCEINVFPGRRDLLVFPFDMDQKDLGYGVQQALGMVEEGVPDVKGMPGNGVLRYTTVILSEPGNPVEDLQDRCIDEVCLVLGFIQELTEVLEIGKFQTVDLKAVVGFVEGIFNDSQDRQQYLGIDLSGVPGGEEFKGPACEVRIRPYYRKEKPRIPIGDEFVYDPLVIGFYDLEKKNIIPGRDTNMTEIFSEGHAGSNLDWSRCSENPVKDDLPVLLGYFVIVGI